MANNIDSIFAFGEDALSNLFEVSNIVFPKPLADEIKRRGINVSSLGGRITAINIPGRSIGTYDRHYKTEVIPLPNGKIEQSKEFSFTLRLDRDLIMHELISSWCDLANSSRNEMWLGKQEDYMGQITVSRCDSSLDIVESGENKGFRFQHVWIKSVGDISYDYSSGEPLDVEVTCCYGYYEHLRSEALGVF